MIIIKKLNDLTSGGYKTRINDARNLPWQIWSLIRLKWTAVATHCTRKQAFCTLAKSWLAQKDKLSNEALHCGSTHPSYLTSKKLLKIESTINPIAIPTKATMNNTVNILSLPQKRRIVYSLNATSVNSPKYKSWDAIDLDTDQYPLMRFQWSPMRHRVNEQRTIPIVQNISSNGRKFKALWST